MIVTSSPTKRARLKTGNYVGDGIDNRNINVGVDLTTKNNRWIEVKDRGAYAAVQRFEDYSGDASVDFNTIGTFLNAIQAFNSTGFQVGTDNKVNANGRTFDYVVFWEEP